MNERWVYNEDGSVAFMLVADDNAELPSGMYFGDGPSEYDIAAQDIRNERNIKLATEVDPIAGNVLRWAALTAEQQQAWADYRQALLDIPEQAGFPHDVVWPAQPEP